MSGKTIGVIGAGAWGTAMAHILASGGHDVELWSMEKEVSDAVNTLHQNTRYLNGFALSPKLRATSDIKQAASDKDFLILASPSLYLARTVTQLVDIPSIVNGSTCIGVLTKGFVPTENGAKLILDVLETVLPFAYHKNLVYISGPSHAEEVAVGKLTGLIAASENPKNSIRFRELMKVRGLMVFSSLDVIGVQICAAAKNVIAVVFGCLDAIAERSDMFGDNTESLLLAAGLNEIQTLGFAMGATHAETFTSIAGVGDLEVTCRSKYGRNRRFGHDIIRKNILDPFTDLDNLIARISEIGYLPEGAVACKYIQEISQKLKIKLPICNGLYRILNKEIKPFDFLIELLR
ncbi:NAD(P)H-dependent glycerol-3-phosphate dehydrogenase [Treponema lecithinolyticum]|uniref:Glycerol-3-phosphate dehydrogenase [NAD(P)+] n=1 Tax=Treponema lecithinolyticum ATCC 700332 TaxID=1321815 RepID=A0ABN0NYH9_TRELE|nr:NAD(P)H-dependent glycerol-3-phosphate dehydrogenase [Treponema lecithinolyticum]ERJ92651.1 putative glycerol-3-phosphate dehydrogenase [NAD(P)+ ] [Treponema lecithinolyticum ATCC 700332]